MKSLLALACLILISLQPMFAQRRSGGGGVSRTPNPGSSPVSGKLFLSGKVVLNDGSAPPQGVLIQSICRGQSRNETHTDAHGSFSFQFGDKNSGIVESGFDAESTFDGRSTNRSTANDAQNCELTASLAGFSADTIMLNGRINGTESVDLGRIVLHRLAGVEGLTMSATTAAAPGPARKAFAKGQEQEKKGDWEQAQKSFEKAVALYVKFAAAWCELGLVQLRQNDTTGALHSFEQSIAADDKYINPYHALMRMAVDAQNWQKVIQTSDKVLALNRVDFPDAWYFNGVSHFYLANLVAAENSARRGLAIDGTHRIPKLEYLLGMILLKNTKYAEATRHLQTYLHLTTKPAEIAEAQKQLDEIARVSGAQTSAATHP
jgi:tetratricopeptide (TPR) repeat protein